MARTKQTRRKPAPHEEVHVLRVGVPGQQSAIRKRAPGSSIRTLASVPVSASAPVSSVRLPNAKASVASVQASQAVRLPASVGLQPKKVSPQDVFNCNEMMRELESAAVRTLAAVFDCSQLRDALEETVFSRDIQGTIDTRVPKE